MLTTFPKAKSIGITGRQAIAVYEILSTGTRLPLPHIRSAMVRRGIMAAETSISARIREINGKLKLNAPGIMIAHEPIKRGSSLNVYWMRKP